MRKNQLTAWFLLGLLLLFFAAFSLSHSNLSHPDSQTAAFSRSSAGPSPSSLMLTAKEYVAEQGAAPDAPPPPPENAGAEKKLIRTAELGLTVQDVRAAAAQIQKITGSEHGEIDNMEITGGAGAVSATLVTRVPSARLEEVLAEYEKLAVRTDREQITGRDVTREFYDNQAHLRNLHAEEEQYLAIMKQAHSVTDILEVSGKLSDVRDRIERLQTQIQVMSHDIEMSAVQITLTQESDSRVLGIQWRPLYNAKTATHDLLIGLGDWVDFIVTLFIKLPLILLWTVTVAAFLLVVWKIARALWRRVKPPEKVIVDPPKPRPAGPRTNADVIP